MSAFDDFARYILPPSLVSWGNRGLSIFKGQFSSASRPARDAIVSYDRMISDYAREVDFPVTRDGKLYYARTSVASLGLLDAQSLNIAERDIRGMIADLVGAGLFSYEKPGEVLPYSPTAWPFRGGYENNGRTLTYDSRMTDPLRFVDIPPRIAGLQLTDQLCRYEPSAFPEKWPRAKGVRAIYPTPKLVTDRSAFSDDSMIERAGRLADAVTRYMRAANVNIRRHPLGLALAQPGEFFGDTLPPWGQNSGAGANVEWLKAKHGSGWRSYWTRNWRGFIHLPPEMADPISSSLTINVDEMVMSSIRQRMKAGYDLGRTGDHAMDAMADATMEFARLVQVASALVEIGDNANGPQSKLTHLHAATLADVTMRRLGYSQLNQPFGSNLYTYLNALEREKSARENQRNANALRVLSMGRYDGDGSGDMVSGATMATLQLALAFAPVMAAGPAGLIIGIAAIVIIGCIALIAWLTGDTEVPRPDLMVLRDGAGNCFPGITAKAAILESPVVRSIPERT